jgi:glycosyltransferase involved in cell wall biosynthesis
VKTIHFHEPPPAQRVGGLDAAIVGLRTAMEKAGVRVEMNPTGRGDAQAAHFHGLWQRNFPGIARAYAARGIPYVVSPHGMLEPWAWRHRWWKKFPYWHLVEKRWTRRAACVLATAEPEAARLRRFFPKTRLECRPLGLTGQARPDYTAARARLGWREDELVLLFLSRIHEKKGLDLLLMALAEMKPAAPPGARLVIVGPEEQPAYVARCRSIATAHEARLPSIHWMGAVWGDERWPYLQGADLFCLPTHSENFGLAVLEALQVGTPALTTTETPWAEVLRENGRGYICTPRKEDVRLTLEEFFARPRRVDRTALAHWAWTNYQWDALAPSYAALYDSLALN